MYVRRDGTLIEVQAPAKINLFLEILGRRDDGFHEIETLMMPISIFDTVFLSSNSERRIELTCRWASGLEAQSPAERSRHGGVWEELPEQTDNTVVRALERLRLRAKVESGARVRLVKRIPAAAGLGGASSDAAAALVAANLAWRLDWTCEQLAGVAAEVGSDVPFFLQTGAAVCRGRGERIDPIGACSTFQVVLVRPPSGLSTPEVYRHCRPAKLANRADPIVEAVRKGRASLVGGLMFNRLEPAAERLSPWIRKLRAAFDRQGCLGHQMSGSGTSYFGICRHASHARRVASRLRAAGLGAVFQTTTLSVAPC
ncbi:MAG: 4-(cytidine 5'-diphospho)-2-C-methyl-D-erythritol kinase [Planctomycetes bacterium]|nr:4-(cytidine 5'-diphospho)-2-C-methyl-D-erythritol kinase [Planctomycetota bacterium]MBL7037296.1 4-(cytidine 5'-diphospho)-2-C-methyl-D-erythritol kinase [Pirellulaceae bacterium]